MSSLAASVLPFFLLSTVQVETTHSDIAKNGVPPPPVVDIDDDGIAEIDRWETYVATSSAASDSKPIFVIVEERLVEASAAIADDPLRRVIERYAADLEKEGFAPWVKVVGCPPRPTHEDGRYVLAFRQLLRAAKNSFPSFQGAVFVGRFPEAMLVRTVNWHRTDAFTLRAGKPDEAKFAERTPWIRSVPELIAHRADIVLADLDGAWETRYVAARTALPAVNGAFPDGIPQNGGGVAKDAEWSAIEYEDFFHLVDGTVTKTADDKTSFVPPADLADAECSVADARRPNRMAVPDVAISRIDAKGVAFSPRPELLDESGHPRAGVLGADAPRSWHSEPWVHDLQLELRLLVEYFDRNHGYRTGALEPAFRPASVSFGLGSGFDVLRTASPRWSSLEGGDLDSRESDLRGVAKWLRTPAVLRTIRAHSDPWGSMFGATDAAALEAENGNVPWSFRIQDQGFEPSLQPACAGGKLDFFLLKTLYENDLLGQGASFYLHTGCEAISPAGSQSLGFSDPNYGVRNGAEALLFLADGLALVGRAKVFYDEPRGFCEALCEGATVGEAWRRYFEIESEAKTWDEVGGDIGRKRAYFWSVLGDWTLKLRQAH